MLWIPLIRIRHTGHEFQAWLPEPPFLDGSMSMSMSMSMTCSVVEPEHAEAHFIAGARASEKGYGSDLLLFGLGVLWWQSSDNSCKI